MIANYPSDEYQYKEYRDTSKYFLSIINHQHLRKIGWTASHKNWRKLWKPKNFVRCCYWWWCWFILNSSHVRFLSTTYTYHRTLNSLRTQFNTEDLTKRSPKKFFNKIMFFVVESPIELFLCPLIEARAFVIK